MHPEAAQATPFPRRNVRQFGYGAFPEKPAKTACASPATLHAPPKRRVTCKRPETDPATILHFYQTGSERSIAGITFSGWRKTGG